MRRSRSSRRRTPRRRPTRRRSTACRRGFDTHPMAAAIVPPPARSPAPGRTVDRSSGDQRVPRDQRGVEGERDRSSRAGDRVCDQRHERRRAERAGRLARHSTASAWPAAGTAIKKPRIALFEPPNSMDAGWTKWVLERYGFEFASSPPPDITGNLRDRSTCIVVGDERRGVLPGGRIRQAGSDRRRRRMTTRASRRSTRSCEAAARWSR